MTPAVWHDLRRYLRANERTYADLAYSRTVPINTRLQAFIAVAAINDVQRRMKVLLARRRKKAA